MSERQQKCVTVVTERYISEPLREFIARMNEHLNSVPEEYRGAAEIEVTSESDWEDSHYPEVRVSYYRPETDEEMAARKSVKPDEGLTMHFVDSSTMTVHYNGRSATFLLQAPERKGPPAVS